VFGQGPGVPFRSVGIFNTIRQRHLVKRSSVCLTLVGGMEAGELDTIRCCQIVFEKQSEDWFDVGQIMDRNTYWVAEIAVKTRPP
jgi:hypothetical protein